MDDLTTSYVEQQGHTMDEVLEAGTVLPVRRTANLHTGGTLHDVTEELHPELAKAALTSAKAIGIPVTGIDLLVPAADQPEYVFIERTSAPPDWPTMSRTRPRRRSSPTCSPPTPTSSRTPGTRAPLRNRRRSRPAERSPKLLDPRRPDLPDWGHE